MVYRPILESGSIRDKVTRVPLAASRCSGESRVASMGVGRWQVHALIFKPPILRRVSTGSAEKILSAPSCFSSSVTLPNISDSPSLMPASLASSRSGAKTAKRNKAQLRVDAGTLAGVLDSMFHGLGTYHLYARLEPALRRTGGR